MIKIKKVLFPTDFSRCAEQAMAHAIYLARQHKAELHFLHALVDYNPVDPISPNFNQIFEQMKEAAENHMARLVEKLQLNDLKVEQLVLPAISAASMIPEYARDYDIDLIV